MGKKSNASYDALGHASVNCGSLQPAGSHVIKPILGGKEPAANAWDAMEEKLRIVEKMIQVKGASKYLTGDTMTIADLDVLITIDFAVGLADLDLTPYPMINEWFKLMTSLPYYEEISGSKIRKLRETLDQEKAATTGGNQ